MVKKESFPIQHLHKEYGKNVIIKDLNLRVKKGKVIVGPSGCGKRLLKGFNMNKDYRGQKAPCFCAWDAMVLLFLIFSVNRG